MIDTEWKGEIQQFPEFTASMSSTIPRYIRTILRQYLEKSDTISFNLCDAIAVTDMNNPEQ